MTRSPAGAGQLHLVRRFLALPRVQGRGGEGALPQVSAVEFTPSLTLPGKSGRG
jgi:hypothetical protein